MSPSSLTVIIAARNPLEIELLLHMPRNVFRHLDKYQTTKSSKALALLKKISPSLGNISIFTVTIPSAAADIRSISMRWWPTLRCKMMVQKCHGKLPDGIFGGLGLQPQFKMKPLVQQEQATRANGPPQRVAHLPSGRSNARHYVTVCTDYPQASARNGAASIGGQP